MNAAEAVTAGEKSVRRDISRTVTEQERAERMAAFRRPSQLHRLAEATGSVCERCEAKIGADDPVWRVWSGVPRAWAFAGWRWCLITMCEGCGRKFRQPTPPLTVNGVSVAMPPDTRRWLEAECEECGRPVVFGLMRRHRRFFCSRCCANKHNVRPHNARRAERRAAAREGLTCAVCDTTFNPSRSDARYCSAACRQRAYRLRKAGAA